MLDEILHFAFWAIVENVLFRVGHLVVRVFSLGTVTISSRRPIVIFAVALLGLAATLVLVAALIRFA